MTLPRRPPPRYRASLRWARRAAVASALLVGGVGCGSNSSAGSSTGGAPGVGGTAGAPGTGGAAGSAGSAGSAGAAGNAGAGGAGGTAACTPAPGYPAGPYGEAVGDTIADWHWKGYVNETAQGLANTHPFVNDYSMDDLRRSGRGYALVHLSESFWPGCKHAAQDLGAQGKSVTDAGGEVVESLDAADATALGAWITAYNLSVTTVTPSQAGQQLIGERETVFIIDLCTMKIVYKTQGNLAGIGPSSITAAVTKILVLLGK